MRVSFNHSGFLAEFGSNKRGTLKKKKKNPQEVLFSFPKLNTKLRLWLCSFVHACVYLTSKALFHHKSSEVFIWLVFYCKSSSFWKTSNALRRRNCQKDSGARTREANSKMGLLLPKVLHLGRLWHKPLTASCPLAIQQEIASLS